MDIGLQSYPPWEKGVPGLANAVACTLPSAAGPRYLAFKYFAYKHHYWIILA
jgi:hypothetical protein